MAAKDLSTTDAVLAWAKQVRRASTNAVGDVATAQYLAMCVRADLVGEDTYDGRAGWLLHCIRVTDSVTKAVAAGATLSQIGDIAHELILARDTEEPRACDLLVGPK